MIDLATVLSRRSAGADPRDVLAAVARDFHARGWMLGTSGNLSLRDASGVWITASGGHKGALGRPDFVRVGLDGALLEAGEGARPSAETSIHLSVYALFPQANACFHVHTVEAARASRRAVPGAEGDVYPMPSHEMLKGLGVWEEAPAADLPVFANHLDVPRVAMELRARLAASPPKIPGVLLRDHGLTTWGRDAAAAFAHVELFDFLFRL